MASERPSPIVRNLEYPTSDDYVALWSLAQQQSVACIAEYEGLGDICQTLWYGPEGKGLMMVISRGVCYVCASEGVEEFTQGCEAVNLRWIVPS